MFFRNRMLISYRNNVPCIVSEFDISITYNSFFPQFIATSLSLNDSLMVKRKQSSDEFLLFFLHFKLM